MTRRCAACFVRTAFGVVVIGLQTGCGRSAPPADSLEPERVPVAYGSQDRDQITGAVSSLPSTDEDTRRYSTVADMLQGRVPGLHLVRTARGVSIRIRGTGTLRADAEPLVVVDGVAMLSSSGGAILNVSPQSVERIEVLKDAAAASLYGVRGANGVIVITTKRGQ